MANINLLPKEKAGFAPALKLTGRIKTATTLILSVFLLTMLGLGVFFVINLTALRNIQNRINGHKEEIASLETTEQKFVLIKDRIAKAETVLKKQNTYFDVANLLSLKQKMGEEIILNQTEISPEGLKLTATISSSDALTRFMAEIIASDYYRNLNLSSFGFNPTAGYIVAIEGSNRKQNGN